MSSGGPQMPAADRSLVELVASAIWDKKGFDVRAYDVNGIIDYTDAMVICSAASDRQAAAIADHVMERLRLERGLKTVGEEGRRGGRWVLLDFSDVVVHVFHRPVRDYYDLDRLYIDCPRITLDEPAWVRDMVPSDFASADDFNEESNPWDEDWSADGDHDLESDDGDGDDFYSDDDFDAAEDDGDLDADGDDDDDDDDGDDFDGDDELEDDDAVARG